MKFPVPPLFERSVVVISLSNFGSLAAVDTLFAGNDEVPPSRYVQVRMDSMAPTHVGAGNRVTQVALDFQSHLYLQRYCKKIVGFSALRG